MCIKLQRLGLCNKPLHLYFNTIFETLISQNSLFCMHFQAVAVWFVTNINWVKFKYNLLCWLGAFKCLLLTFEFVCCKWLCFRPSPDWAWWRGSAFEPTTLERSAFVGSEIRKCEEVWKSIPRRDNRRKLESGRLRVSDPG